MGVGLGGIQSGASVGAVLADLVGQDIVTKSISLSQASGSNAIVLQTTGARLKLSSAGTSDYLTSDGANTISTPGGFTANGLITTGNGILFSDFVDDSANPGNRTVNANRGKNAVAAGASTCVITNNKVTTARMVVCILEANDATALYVRSVVPSGTGFTLTVSANATANLVFSWVLFD